MTTFWRVLEPKDKNGIRENIGFQPDLIFIHIYKDIFESSEKIFHRRFQIDMKVTYEMKEIR